MEWKIVNSDKASKLHISVISPNEKGFLVIDLSYIPKGMSTEEFIKWIQNQKIVQLDSFTYDMEHRADKKVRK